MLEKYNIKDAIYNVAAAWDAVPNANLVNTRNKLWPSRSLINEQNNESQISLHINKIHRLFSQADVQVTEEGVSSWINIDSNVCGFDLMSNDEIIRSILTTNFLLRKSCTNTKKIVINSKKQITMKDFL